MSKTALVTTTINVPTVLKLYRACSPDVHFFITGDRKSPDANIMSALDGLGNFHYLGATAQGRLGYKCSDLIGWNTISRRCVAILEALRWGAEIIVTIDDDNIPLELDYFEQFESILDERPWSGIQVSGFNGWFDVGRLLRPVASHRGFPHQVDSLWSASPVTGARVGVAAGICLGDPDVGAVERIANHPVVHGVSELLRSGIVVEPGTWTVFNSQNTAFLRELAPCFLLPAQFDRYDDIFASLICQRVMRERGYVVHFGQPFVWQERNKHDLVKDLRAEMFGMQHVVELSDWLDSLLLTGSNLDMIRHIYESFSAIQWMPAGVSELGAAWCGDVERVL